ncbi:MAG: ATPase [Pseudomonadota bacterium]
MIYPDAAAWRAAGQKRIALFGMSGLGKTTCSNLLRQSGAWFHYSVDYRIGTRYMGEYIADNFKREAMKTPFLRELLRSDSIHIASNITFHNLSPLSTYLGKPGDAEKGGIDYATYVSRQEEHREAEINALLDTVPFIEKARTIYGYDHFVCDTGGSICEVVDSDDPDDPVLSALAAHLLLIWIQESDADAEELAHRFDQAPKPMYYRREELDTFWADYLAERGVAPDAVDPDDFIRYGFRRQLPLRRPRYAAMAANWGITLAASDVAKVRTADDFGQLIERTLEAAP